MPISNRVSVFAVGVICLASIAVADDDRWWPVQALPRGVVRTREHASLSHQMLVQSVAGLAAKSVNSGQGDELVWVYNSNTDVELWYAGFLKDNPSIEERGELEPWELVDRYAQKGAIKGYILYAPDESKGETNDHRVGMNLSVNVATSVAGMIDGVIVSESLEEEAKAHGLTLLLDVRDKTQAWCFETYKDKFNRRMMCAQDPRKSNIRDLAIAQHALVLFGAEEPTESALKWLEPLSPIAGWNGGDEFKTTRQSSIYGHIQTATDWCMNLPVLMAGSERVSVPQVMQFDPKNIDWNDKRSCISFALTDGDNVQWFESSFFGNKSYWSSTDRGKIPFGWSCCFSQLAQVCPTAIGHALATKKEPDRFIEWGAGYYYPDHFGHARPNRDELLARHAQRTWKFMRDTGSRIIAFNVAKVDSKDAIKSYQTIAGETDDLLAIMAFQYVPYEGGAGKTYWVKDRRGIEIPVITARYSIWENSNRRKRSGTPTKVAREIREAASGAAPRHDWVIVHAWSYFQHTDGTDENAENMPQEGAADKGGIRGYEPAVWCADRLPQDVHVVTPEEMTWRIRMERDPVTTKRLIDGFDSR